MVCAQRLLEVWRATGRHGDDAAATTRTAALARDLHDECNRAVDKYWSKPNKKGDVFCIFDDASDDETVAALGT